jgi:hypothetical protein
MSDPQEVMKEFIDYRFNVVEKRVDEVQSRLIGCINDLKASLKEDIKSLCNDIECTRKDVDRLERRSAYLGGAVGAIGGVLVVMAKTILSSLGVKW